MRPAQQTPIGAGWDEIFHDFKDSDRGTGLHYFWARYYDSEIGRFVSVDPHADIYATLTPYDYAGNDPLAFIDPTGMDSIFYNQDGSKKTVKQSWWHNLWHSDTYYYEGSEKALVSHGRNKYWEIEKAIADRLDNGKRFNLYENNFDINPWVKSHLSKGSFPMNLDEVFNKSPQRKAWDCKRALDPNGIYIMESKGYLRDYIGNAIWGGIMANANYHQNIAVAGAGMRQIWDTVFGKSRVYPSNFTGFFDDPRDTEAIRYGYRRAVIWFR